MVKREPHPTDGRQAIVTLSQKGSDVITAERDAREEWLSARLDELTPEERLTLAAVVPIINKVITSDDDR